MVVRCNMRSERSEVRDLKLRCRNGGDDKLGDILSSMFPKSVEGLFK